MKTNRFFIIIITFTILLSLFPQISYTAPTNGTYFPEQGKSEAGYEYNYMHKRQLRRDYGALRIRDHFYVCSVGVFDWLAVNGKIGLGDIRHTDDIHRPQIDYEPGFAGGYGFRIKAYEDKEKKLSLIFGFQHISVHPLDEEMEEDKFEGVADDQHVSAIIAKEFTNFTAYAGIRGAECDIIYGVNGQARKRRTSKKFFGVTSGVDIYLFDHKMRLNFEGRFIDETAVSTTITYLF
ncbi:MAG: hypothetical protein JW869_01490 [Candidatus Omnitrophica bacterium]|nr:hypothetical protein [Candidatus Omnitrophota bacterium]